MKNLYKAIVFLILLLSYNAQAQLLTPYQQMQQRELLHNQNLFAREGNQAEAGNGMDYDIKYHRLNLRINPDSSSVPKYVRGSVTTYFTTSISNFSILKFDFASDLICDSVRYHGAKITTSAITENVDTLKITLPMIATVGTLDSVTIYYKGVPPVVPDFSGGTGFVNKGTGSNKYIYTLSEPYSSYTWWPCKSFITADKVDSLDIYVSCPTAFRVAANGKRMVESSDGTNRITYWKHRYPISSYQVAVAVAKYVQYPSTPTQVNIGGTNMDLYNLVLSTPNTSSQTALNRTADMLVKFSAKFSDYAFKSEKYGHYTFGFSGGMEHNTFSGMSASTYDAQTDWDIIAHELGHQWFGASVTCGSWRDIWLNESFATYIEIVYLKNKTADGIITTTPYTWRNNMKTSSLSASYQAKPIYQADTTTMTDIFTPAVYVYERGAMFINMLRKTLGDTKFFQALQNYQLDPALRYGYAFTDDVRRHMELASGLDLTEMFNDWIYKKGYALYNGATWNNSGNQIVLRLPQTVNGASDNTHFDMPLVIKISRASPAKDTTVVLFDKNGTLYTVNNGVFTSIGSGNIIQIGLSFTPTTLAFDPESEILANGSFSKDAGLALLATKVVSFSAVKDNNDAKLLWGIDQGMEYNSFEV